ncbi:MAG: heavy metal translocating P-type ATPase [Ferrimonas sp.]
MYHAQVKHQLPGRVRLAIMIDGADEDATWADHGHYLRHRLLAFVGVTGVRVNVDAQSLLVEYDALQLEAAQIQQHVRTLPSYDAAMVAPISEDDNAHQYTRGEIYFNLLGLVASSVLPSAFSALTTTTIIAPTIFTGIEQLQQQQLNGEVLDAIAIGLSAYRGDYRTAMLTQTLLSIGEYLEQQTSRKSDSLLVELMQPKDSQVWVLRQGQSLQLSSAELQVGDQVRLTAGELIPADGRVLRGVALVNQAALTGEAVPVRREAEAILFAGTILHDGNITMVVDKVGADTTTAQVAALITDALAQKSQTQLSTQAMADRRVKITLGMGALVYALTRDLERMASVFLVDYSCALKLSTPVTFKALMYAAAKQGIVFKGGRAIEELAEIDTVVFDKTGTLTHGTMEVTDVICMTQQQSAQELLALAASVEEHCNHPLSQALVNAAKQQDLPHIDHGEVDYVVAHGLRCQIQGTTLVIGSRHFLEAHEKVDFNEFSASIQALEQAGKHVLYMAVDGHPLGLFGLRDSLREEVVDTLARLRQSGVEQLLLLTGDTEIKAQQLAEQLGLDGYLAQTDPKSKAAVIAQLQQAGRRVLFVGDGVNDAPALTTADVGVAMAAGTELAQLAADVTLLQDSLLGVAQAREFAQQGLRLIGSNIRLAELANSGIMLAAATGMLKPSHSALLHNGTTLAVLARALQARRWQR